MPFSVVKASERAPAVTGRDNSLTTGAVAGDVVGCMNAKQRNIKHKKLA